jgi:dTDP-4-dehydrorhamnose 3,5-epimerase-like enzyme
MSVDDCALIELPRFADPRGSLGFFEGERHVPFSIARIFYVYDVPEGAARGGHAHHALHQFLVCLAGAMTVTVDDGRATKRVRLDRPNVGLHIPPMIWASESEFGIGTVYFVAASAAYDAASYLRDYDAFTDELNRRTHGSSKGHGRTTND